MPFDLDLPLLLVIAGVVLMVLEALAPGAHFVVLGVALLAAGLLGLVLSQTGLLVGTGLVLLLSVFVFVFGAIALYIYREFEFYEGTDAGSTSDSSSLRGQTGRVTERVTATDGQVKLDNGGFNPFYQARSMDREIEEGEEVIVIDPGGGNVLTVDSFGDLADDEIDRELERDRRQKESGERDTRGSGDSIEERSTGPSTDGGRSDDDSGTDGPDDSRVEGIDDPETNGAGDRRDTASDDDVETERT